MAEGKDVILLAEYLSNSDLRGRNAGDGSEENEFYCYLGSQTLK